MKWAQKQSHKPLMRIEIIGEVDDGKDEFDGENRSELEEKENDLSCLEDRDTYCLL